MSQKNEFEDFDKVMGGLLSVPYKELQQKLEDEKENKGKQKRRRATSSPVSRASSALKKRVG